MRRILHCDLNNFFASVEEINNPELKNVPMAVCGDPTKRHGIILAKNKIAKSLGIYTPELVSSAKAKCPDLVLVEPHFEEYYKYSKLVNEIYLKYTDRVEPFSIDESYLDVTLSQNLFGSAKEIAYKIKEEIKAKYGLTISVGVSFNKSLAKMGSDMKKPDAITELYEDNFKEKIYNMPVSSLLFAGKSTCEELKKLRINTIGDLAYYDKDVLSKKIGKLGIMLYNVANGIDSEEVKKYTDEYIPKSISKGMTLVEDTSDKEILNDVCTKLCTNVVKKLREQKMKCSVVCINLKNSDFVSSSKQKKIGSTDSYQDILKVAKEILDDMISNSMLIRTITVAVSGIIIDETQMDIFNIIDEKNKINKAQKVVDNIKDKNSNIQIGFANLFDN